MRDERKRSSTDNTKGGAAAVGANLQDPQTAKLLKAGKSLGNDEIQKRISQGNATRDQLLAFLAQRLDVMRQAQVRELDFQNNKREHVREIADTHKADFTKPDPTRFREAARVYEEAAEALCRGQLGRGAELVERALSSEQKALQTLPTKVVDVDDLALYVGEAPESMKDVAPGQACGERQVPVEIDVAKEIQNVTTRFDDPAVRRRVADPWWTEDEEEEEEGAGDGGGK